MNDAKLANFRTALIEMARDITDQNTLGQQAQKTVELDQQAVGRLSRMDALQQQAMAKATQTRRDQMSDRIAAALQRMDDGEYGYCMDCGDEIADQRLELDPTAPLCVNCARG